MKLKQFMANTLPRARGKSKRKQQSLSSAQELTQVQPTADPHNIQQNGPQVALSVHINKYVAGSELDNKDVARNYSDPLFVNLNFGERQSKCACYKHVIIDEHNFPPLHDKNAENCPADFDLTSSWTDNNYNTLPRVRPRIKTNPWLPSPRSSPSTSPGSTRTTSSTVSSPADGSQAALEDSALEEPSSTSGECNEESKELSKTKDYFPTDHLCGEMPSLDSSIMTSMTSDSGRFSMTGSDVSSLVSSTMSDGCEPVTRQAPALSPSDVKPLEAICLSDAVQTPDTICDTNESRLSALSQAPDIYIRTEAGQSVQQEEEEPDLLIQFQSLIPNDDEEDINYEELFEKNIELVTSESGFSFDQCVMDEEGSLSDDFLESGVDIFADECTDEFLFQTATGRDFEDKTDRSETCDNQQEEHGAVTVEKGQLLATPARMHGSYYDQLVEDICKDAIAAAKIEIKTEIDYPSKLNLSDDCCINEPALDRDNCTASLVNKSKESFRTDTKESLQEKVRRLKAGRRIIEEKIREAQEEEQLRLEQRMRFQRQITLHRKEMLLKTLGNLREKLADQCTRLQASYNNVLEMQRNILRQHSRGDLMLSGSTFELTV
ncbi:uncharacterized protein LOC106174099 [Lingula anatina]|uniref:Uncharacterized protein LOC106174099 n=1 Tax=Lingula anatina TaxID=7574 RepID=A0A1S3JKK3_LINAN|nr:uncharacterized protein LOC106174099 [Lingula anatina]XP_013410947.1 uncharacterized protein LOC106174099 [Lingula anatina]XP_013410948.1 uncharacterized protein LOC106174099 [Lingula anatina]XP_013410949.1 uncharacterized protein LOC106174099 [Lingula anatina]XP_013410950.1 uncharacterized protein LOC106174099 [Lingula anatina]XP_013410951.1 uncharacterized protein LOC106174099 [Lingula anatina]|eukprot:XP_013410946.1 uncharacterized protein LOC106174099 [Lingula anatina]